MSILYTAISHWLVSMNRALLLESLELSGWYKYLAVTIGIDYFNSGIEVVISDVPSCKLSRLRIDFRRKKKP